MVCNQATCSFFVHDNAKCDYCGLISTGWYEDDDVYTHLRKKFGPISSKDAVRIEKGEAEVWIYYHIIPTDDNRTPTKRNFHCFNWESNRRISVQWKEQG